MEDGLFAARRRLVVRAFYLAPQTRLQGIDRSRRLAVGPLVLRAGGSGISVLFRYGVVVVFGLDAEEEASFLQSIGPLLPDRYPEAETEETVLIRRPGEGDRVEEGAIILAEFTIGRLQLVADVLAKSLVLARHETGINESFERIEPLAAGMRETGRGVRRGRELIRHIGDTLSVQVRMVGLVEVHDKPELLWEQPELDRFYQRLAEEYELQERHRALERKLEVISRTAQTLLELLQSRRTLRVEWYIVILIVAEIVIMLGEKTL